MREVQDSVLGELAALCDGCPFDVSVSVSTGEDRIDVRGERRTPSASLIKVPIALSVCAEISRGSLRLEDRLAVESQALCGGTGVLADLSPVPEMTVADLLRLMIGVSDNSATNILIDRLGFDVVNRWCHDNGLRETELNRLMMDHEAMRRGIENLTSANDMVSCMERILPVVGQTDPSDPAAVVWRAMLRQQHRNGLPRGEFETEGLSIGNKTGSFGRYEHDVAICAGPRASMTVAVMTNGAPTVSAALGVLNSIGAIVRRLA